MSAQETTETIKFTLDGKEVEARAGETIWDVAKRQGNTIPHLCHRPQPGYRPDANCRACMVEIKGERVLAPSCRREPTNGIIERLVERVRFRRSGSVLVLDIIG